MTQYRRPHTPGATWFFTVNLAQRRGNTLLVDHVDHLRESLRRVKQQHPFRIDAMVVLPEHLHAIWTLPPGDHAIGIRWGLIVSIRRTPFWRNPHPMLKSVDPHRCLEGIDGAASAVGFGGLVHADFGGFSERLERCGVLPVAGLVIRHVHGVAGPVKS